MLSYFICCELYFGKKCLSLICLLSLPLFMVLFSIWLVLMIDFSIWLSINSPFFQAILIFFIKGYKNIQKDKWFNDIYGLIWSTYFHFIVFLQCPWKHRRQWLCHFFLLLYDAEFLNQYPALCFLVHKSNAFSIHCLEGVSFFLFQEEYFCFYN